MRVLHVVKTGVGATWAVRQIQELTRLGVAVHVAVPSGPRVADYKAAGATVHIADLSLPTRAPHTWSSRRKTIREIVAAAEPDLIHSHFVSTTLSLRLALGRNHPIPRLFQVPGPLHLENGITARADLWTAGPADRWIATCRWTRDAYIHLGVASRRVSLSYYGLDVAKTRAADPVLRTELGIAEGVPLVGMVAFMYAPRRLLGQKRGIKGHEDLIDAMVAVRRERNDAVAVLVGGAWAGATDYEARVRSYAEERLGDSVFMLGTRSDISALYPDFTVAVHPSHSENLGGAGESSLFSVPAIATTVGGFPDLIVDGETGILVPPRKPELLAEAILEVIEEPDSAVARAERARTKALGLLDLEANVRELLRIYDETLGSES